MKKIKLNNKKRIIIFLIFIVSIIVVLFVRNKSTIFQNNVEIKKSKSELIKLINYEHDNFKMKIPEGWVVDTDGDNMYFSLRAYNPNDERYQIYSILKAEPLLKNDQAKQWYENYYNSFGGNGNKMLAKAIVVSSGTAKNFYINFNNYINFAKEMGSTFKAPDLSNFEVIEEFKNNSGLSNIAKDDKIIRGTFENSTTGKKGEGLFMASIVEMGSDISTLGYDVLFYTAYNVIGISTPEYELVNYQDILTKSLNSLIYKDSFVNATINNGKEETKNALSLNSSIQQAYNSYNDAWTSRQKKYDINSQKYSDTTLGYERVYNTDTGEIYKAYNGFTDEYTGSKYKSITEDMYSEKVSGYIER